MSVPAENVQRLTKPAIPNAQTRIKGRLLQSPRRFQSQTGVIFFHLVVMPAPDEYSNPQTVEIRAVEKIGERDEEIVIDCRIGGYRRSVDYIDKRTGEHVKFTSAEMYLEAVI